MPKDVSFAKSIKKLELIVEKLESGDVDLEEGLKLLEEGLKLHKLCEDKLKGAKVKIDRLVSEGEVN